MPLPRFSQFTRGASVAKRNLPSLSSLSLSQPLIGTSASTPVTIAPGPTVVERLAKFQSTIGATGETIPLRIQGIAEKTFGGLTRYITRFPSTVVRTALQLDPEEKTFVGGFLADIGKNIESINQKPSKTFTEIGEEFKQSLPKVGFFKDMDPTAAGIALTVIDGWIAADLVKLSKDSLLLGARQIAQKLPREFLYQLEKSNLPAKDVLAALRGTGSSPEAQRFVASLNVEDVRLTKELFTSARTAERLGVGIQTEKAVGRTAIGKFAGVEEAPSFKDFTRMAPEQQLPGMANIGKPQPKFGLSIQPVRRVGGLPEIPKKSVFLGKEAYEEGRGLAKISPQRETELKAIGERVKNAIPKELEPLAQEARKYKSAEEFVKQFEYHGGAAKLEGRKLSIKFDKSGGIFTTPNETTAETWRALRSGKTYQVYLGDRKLIDLTELKTVEKIKGLIGTKYTVDGETVVFTKNDYDFLFPDGKADWATFSNYIPMFEKMGYEGARIREGFNINTALWKDIEPLKGIMTKSQLTDFFTQATKGIKEIDITASISQAKASGQSFDEIAIEMYKKGFSGKEIGKELRVGLKAEIKATKKEIKNAEIAADKAAKLEIKQQKIRQEAIENIQRHTRGNTDNSIAQLKARNLSEEDIANIVLEDGTKLVDTVKVKRTADGTLSAVIKKSEIENIAKNYTDELPKQKWEKRSMLVEGVEVPIKAARSIELPYVYFERKGLSQIYDPIIQSGRDAETMKSLFLKRFKDAGLFKEGGWFTADRFNLPKSEAEGVANYYLGRQGRRDPVALGELSEKSRKFVEIFDGIIKETEDRFFEVAKKMGKTPSRVADYAPIMTSKDIKLVDQGGAMDWLFRNHPAFFSLKERVKIVPIELYELDYREVAARWLDGITQFLNYGETANRLKYLINSDQFKGMVKENDWQFISNWLREVTTPELPTSVGGQAANSLSRLLRKGVAMGSLGLNYASVAKQALTQIPILVIEKALPKLKSQYAKAFGVDVSQLPSITKRRGDIAIQDLQGKIGRVFTGALTQFDKKNAQLSLNALLDKEYGKFLKGGAEITPEIQKVIEKRAQDAIDMWYGGFFKGQRPEAFRKELGNFILMFLYPLTSQLNGFFRHILIAQGWSKARAAAEVLAAAVAIAYAEQVIENLSPQWSDEVGMTKDTLVSLSGNIPLLSQIVWAVATEQDLQISPVIGNINNIVRNIGKGEGEKVAWGIAETFGTPKQIRRIKEGLEIMEEGGITDNEGKMLAPVQDAVELTRSFLRGKYGSIASQDWLRNIGEKSEDRRWFVPQVEFLQNGDYERKAELYLQFSPDEQEELRDFLSENQQKKLDSALRGGLPALRNLPQLPGLHVLPSNELPTLPSTKLPALPGLPKL